MKAWQLDRLDGQFHLRDLPVPIARAGTVVVRIEVSYLMSYLKAFAAGELPGYQPPRGTFTPGGNGVGVVHEVGPDVYHLEKGQRAIVSSHIVATENVLEPAQILLGVTSFAPPSDDVQASFHDGTLAEYVLVPASSVTPVIGFDEHSSEQLAVLSRCAVPYGGLVRGRLAAGETLIVTGATGSYGAAGVLVGLALGATRVVAAGRNKKKLDALVEATKARAIPVVLTGDVQKDSAALREAAGGGAQVAFDMVGSAKDPNATMAGLGALRRGGRLVLMGSMTSPLPLPYLQLMLNNIEVIGNFMHGREAYGRVLELLRAGRLDVDVVARKVFAFEELPTAMEAAKSAGNLECVLVRT